MFIDRKTGRTAQLTDVRVPEMRAGRLGDEAVPEGVAGQNRTLAHVGRAVHVGAVRHVLAVPVQGRAVGVHHVLRVDYHPVALADLPTNHLALFIRGFVIYIEFNANVGALNDFFGKEYLLYNLEVS